LKIKNEMIQNATFIHVDMGYSKADKLRENEAKIRPNIKISAKGLDRILDKKKLDVNRNPLLFINCIFHFHEKWQIIASCDSKLLSQDCILAN